MKHKQHRIHKHRAKGSLASRLFRNRLARVAAVGVVFGLAGLPIVISYAQQPCKDTSCSSATGASSSGSAVSVQCDAATDVCSSSGNGSTGKSTGNAAKNSPAKAPSTSVSTATPAASGTATKSAAAAPVVTAPASQGISAKYGIAAGSSLTHLSGAALASQLDDMRSMGVGWVRFDMEWSNIEPSQGSYNWGVYDAVVQGVRARGMRVLAVIDYTPGWARPAGCGSDKCAPADPNTYGNFAGTVASHYGNGAIAAYEIWNEPNSTEFFKPAANASQYTQMLSAAYAKIKAVSPGSQVITGGTSPRDTGGGNLSPIDFVQGIYNAGAKNSLDAIGVHPYTFPVTAAYGNPYNAWGQVDTIHNIMVNSGDGGKLVWSTEYGAPTGGPGSAATASNLQIGTAWHVDEALQAQSVSDAIRLNSSVPWKGPLLWYSYKDAGTTQDTNENFFGLIRADGSRKPAYASFVDALNTYN